MSKVVLFMADGFEECEGLIVVDILRRAEIEVTTVSITGSLYVKSAHGINIMTDKLAVDINFDEIDMIVLPGGMPGTTNLATCKLVSEQCKVFAAKKLLAAICAAPSIPGQLGLLKGKKATCYPGFETYMTGAEATFTDIATGGNIITGRALGAAIPFSLELVRRLSGQDRADKVARSICYFK